MKVSKVTYGAVWDGLLEVSRARHYFAAHENGLACQTFVLRFALALAGVGAMASLVQSLVWLAPISGAAVAALVILELLWDGTTRVAQLKTANRELAALDTRYRAFWDEIRNGAIADQEANERKNELLATLNRIASNVDIAAKEKFVQQAQERAFKGEELRYAT